MKRVIVESPFAAPKELRDEAARADRAYTQDPSFLVFNELTVARNAVAMAEAKHRRYLRALALFCLSRGESPYASHAILPQWLDDNDPVQRQLGIDAGLVWAPAAELVVFGIDCGISGGMRYAYASHVRAGRPVEFVELGANWDTWQASYPKHQVELDVRVVDFERHDPRIWVP